MIRTILAWQVLQVLLLAPGLVFSGVFLILAKPWRWQTPGARDYGALVLVLFLLFAWLEWRLGVRIGRGGDGQLPSGGDQLISIAFMAGLDVVMAARLHHFWVLAREERAHPVQPCPICGGRAVVPIGWRPEADNRPAWDGPHRSVGLGGGQQQGEKGHEQAQQEQAHP